jgi:hypothetical protein
MLGLNLLDLVLILVLHRLEVLFSARVQLSSLGKSRFVFLEELYFKFHRRHIIIYSNSTPIARHHSVITPLPPHPCSCADQANSAVFLDLAPPPRQVDCLFARPFPPILDSARGARNSTPAAADASPAGRVVGLRGVVDKEHQININ